MKNDLLTTQLFQETSVNVNRLEAYLKAPPIYYAAALRDGASENALYQLYYTDAIEFAFRLYLVGQSKTLRRVYQVIRQFQQADNLCAWHMIALCLEVIRYDLLQFEGYELMPRYQHAINQIGNRFIVDMDGCLKIANRRMAQSQRQC